MPKNRDDDIEAKLERLELALSEEQLKEEAELTRQEKKRDLDRREGKAEVATTDGELRSDLFMIGGLVSLAIGLLMVFSNIKIGTGALTWFGFGAAGAGFVFLPLLVGIGMLFYNSKWRAAYIVLGLGLVLITVTLLSQLVITFPFVNAISFLLMFIPIAAGIALMMRGAGMRKRLKKDND